MQKQDTYFSFEVLHTSKKSRARVGRIHTPHGVIDTPNFVAVGTNATLKALDNSLVSSIGLQLMFCNTYHLMLQPGTQIIRNAGGLHKFMNRSMPIITDSGGFQVFSLAYGSVKDELKSKGTKRFDNSVIKINEDGVLFRSYRDGNKILLTPETSVQAQKDLGADIIIPFDELPPYHIDQSKLEESLNRTHRWQKRSLDAHLTDRQQQAMYAVIHGGTDITLRAKSCDFLTALPFDGFAIGGSFGKNHQDMYHMLEHTVTRLPYDKPNHLLGMGDLNSMQRCIELGIDTMDSSHPTRSARHGLLFTDQGGVKILNSCNKTSYEPIDSACPCLTCRQYSRAYVHHLFKAKEIAGMVLATIHNVTYMVNAMAKYRELITCDLL